jgi:F-type H+-transporting ATPase subunit alpha
LNQPQYDPWPTEEQVVAIYAGINGFLDEIPAQQVRQFQDELREHLRSEKSIYQQIRDTGELPDDLAAKLDAEIEKFTKGFNIQEESALV